MGKLVQGDQRREQFPQLNGIGKVVGQRKESIVAHQEAEKGHPVI